MPDEFFGVSLTSGTIGDTFVLLILLTLLGGIIVVALRWWWWRTQEFLVTNRRLMLAWGVLNKSSSDSSLEKINDLQLDISALGRLLDFGSLKVMTAAPMQGAEYLDRLNHAKEFKKTLMTAKHDLQMSQGTRWRGLHEVPLLHQAARCGCGRAGAQPSLDPGSGRGRRWLVRGRPHRCLRRRRPAQG